MPIHDWTRTYPGAFHHFHGTWLFRLAEALNAGILPPGFYREAFAALPANLKEQLAGG